MTERTLASREEFLRSLDQTIERHDLLQHPFYQAWSRGELSKDTLAEYARQYYAHVRRFPTYVSATHASCPDLRARQELLDNLIEEERGEDNHPELWKRFAESLGVARDELETTELLPQTADSVGTLTALTRDPNYLHGVAALYAFESQVPDIARRKREGLKAFYGLEDARAVQYFTVHEEADVRHREGERRILAENCRTVDEREAAIAAAETAARALWTFLDGIDEACRR